jgi:hypothetical protein
MFIMRTETGLKKYGVKSIIAVQVLITEECNSMLCSDLDYVVWSVCTVHQNFNASFSSLSLFLYSLEQQTSMTGISSSCVATYHHCHVVLVCHDYYFYVLFIRLTLTFSCFRYGDIRE